MGFIVSLLMSLIASLIYLQTGRITSERTQLAVRGITILRNVKMPETLQKAIQEKLKAEQENEQMKFVLEKERQEADRKRIEAKGIADSQKIISGGLTNQVLQLRSIEATEKLAQSNNSKIVVIGAEKGGMPILIQLNTEKSKP